MFSEYVKHIFEEKNKTDLAGDRTLKHMAKILMNSLFVGFGLDPRLPMTDLVRHEDLIPMLENENSEMFS